MNSLNIIKKAHGTPADTSLSCPPSSDCLLEHTGPGSRKHGSLGPALPSLVLNDKQSRQSGKCSANHGNRVACRGGGDHCAEAPEREEPASHGTGPNNRTAVPGSHLGVATEHKEGPSTVKTLRIKSHQ